MTQYLSRFIPWTVSLAAVVLAFVLAACAPASGRQADGPRDECGLIEPTNSDLEFALSFGKGAFTSVDWLKSYTVEPYKISLTRSNDVLGGVAYLEYLIFNCGYSQADLDGYFNDQNFSIIFGGYESHALTKFCETEDLSLYEYDLVEAGVEFQARYWVEQASDTRLLVMMLVFPKATPVVLAEYSQKIYPKFTACE
jgi:hypothetical protein